MAPLVAMSVAKALGRLGLGCTTGSAAMASAGVAVVGSAAAAAVVVAAGGAADLPAIAAAAASAAVGMRRVKPPAVVAALLLPVAIASTFAGVWLVRRVSPAHFYTAIYALMVLVGVKLIWDALA